MRKQIAEGAHFIRNGECGGKFAASRFAFVIGSGRADPPRFVLPSTHSPQVRCKPGLRRQVGRMQPYDFPGFLKSSADTILGLKSLEAPFLSACDVVSKSFATGGKLLACGNGGSAADCAHLTAEFTGRFVRDRRPYPALCFRPKRACSPPWPMTMAMTQFLRGNSGVWPAGRRAIALTTSGNSANVLCALEAARELGVSTIALLGRDGGKAHGKADMELARADTISPPACRKRIRF